MNAKRFKWSGFIIPLSEERALQLGSALIREFIVFSIALFFAVWQFSKQSEKESEKMRAHETEKSKSLVILKKLTERIEEQQETIDGLLEKIKIVAEKKRKFFDSKYQI